MESFTVRAVAVQELEDINTFLIALAENPDGTGRRLEVQRALEFDEQDQELGQDTYCLCTAEGAVHYGGVARHAIDAGALEIHLDAAAAQVLGVEGFLLRLDVSAEAVQSLADGLHRAIDDA
jgi:hypothetical protein